MHPRPAPSSLFFFNDTATTEIYTLSLHDALPICSPTGSGVDVTTTTRIGPCYRSESRIYSWRAVASRPPRTDWKSTRLNSSHGYISYAVFCLKKKKKRQRVVCPSAEPVRLSHAHP